jgi:hypothetical protein
MQVNVCGNSHRSLCNLSSLLCVDKARKLCTARGWNTTHHGEWTDYQPCEKTTSILTIEYLRLDGYQHSHHRVLEVRWLPAFSPLST